MKTHIYATPVVKGLDVSTSAHHATYNDTTIILAVQSQKAVSAYLISKQILPFGFAEYNCIPFKYYHEKYMINIHTY